MAPLLVVLLIPATMYAFGYLVFRDIWCGRHRAMTRFAAWNLFLVGVLAWANVAWLFWPALFLLFASLYVFYRLEGGVW